MTLCYITTTTHFPHFSSMVIMLCISPCLVSTSRSCPGLSSSSSSGGKPFTQHSRLSYSSRWRLVAIAWCHLEQHYTFCHTVLRPRLCCRLGQVRCPSRSTFWSIWSMIIISNCSSKRHQILDVLTSPLTRCFPSPENARHVSVFLDALNICDCLSFLALYNTITHLTRYNTTHK